MGVFKAAKGCVLRAARVYTYDLLISGRPGWVVVGRCESFSSVVLLLVVVVVALWLFRLPTTRVSGMRVRRGMVE